MVKKIFKGGTAEMANEVERELDCWEDGYLNRHLAWQMLELVLVRCLPEMGEDWNAEGEPGMERYKDYT